MSIRSFVDTTSLNLSAAPVILLPQQSGSTFIMTKNAAVTHVLPSPTIAGIKYRIYNSSVVAVITRFDSGGNSLVGSWTQVNGTKTITFLSRYINFTATSQQGDYIDLISDGTLWRVEGQTGDPAGVGLAFQ